MEFESNQLTLLNCVHLCRKWQSYRIRAQFREALGHFPSDIPLDIPAEIDEKNIA